MRKLWLPRSAEERLEQFRCEHSFKVYHGDLEFDALGRITNELVHIQDPVLNLVVTRGKRLVLDRLFALGSEGGLSHVGVGTDSTAAVVGQTQLNPTVSGSVSIKVADGGTARVSETVTIAATFASGDANFSWNEGALFNGATNVTDEMFNRIVFGPFNKTTAVAIVYQVQVTQT